MPISLKDNCHLNFSSIPLELRLILSCLRASLGQKEEAQIHALCSRIIDWDALIKLVDRHRVPSPVYQNLNRFGENIIPESVLIRLKNRFHRNAQRVLAKTAELVRIVKRFEKNGISVLPLKGPVLALQLYGDLGSRHVGDLDIMVPPKRVLEAQGLLLQGGYRRTHPNFELTPRQDLVYVRNNQHFGYFRKDLGIRVELHWRFGSNRYIFPLRFNELWRDRQTIQLGGADMATLSLEHTILFLCTHGAIHAWFRLFWLNDVAQLMIKNDSIDWNTLMRHAGQLGISRMVAEGVVLASSLLGSPLPEPVRVFAEQDRGVDRLARTTFYLINHPGGPSHKPFTRPYYCSKVHRVMLRGDPRYKLAFCARLLGGGYGDWYRVPLPDGLFPLYYLLRPFMWFFRWYVPRTRVYREGPAGRKNGATR